MTDTPERVWIQPGGGCLYFYEEDELHDAGRPVTGYIRADLYDALTKERDGWIGNAQYSRHQFLEQEVRAEIAEAEVERLRTENQRLRAVLKQIASTGRCEFATVRAALRNTETSHDD